MEEIMIALSNIQKEMNAQKIENRKNCENITKEVTQNINKMLDERFLIWEEQKVKLEKLIENQEHRIYLLEKEARQRNLVFFGIEEGESSYENLQNKFINIIQEHLTICMEPRDIQAIRRIGKRRDSPRPIKVIFSTLAQKINILKKKVNFKNTKYYCKEDFPQQVLEKRKELQEQAKIEYEKGNKVKIVYDKLVILKTNNKRSLPSSPSDNSYLQGSSKLSHSSHNTGHRNPKQRMKMNKTNNMNNFVIKKHTLSLQDKIPPIIDSDEVSCPSQMTITE